jgi:hypothetical protein
MLIQILDRYETESDWHEIYANGELLYEGELTVTRLLQRFLTWLAEKENVELEIRDVVFSYETPEDGEYAPPLHSMTGESYWSEWETANERDTLP